MSDNRRWLVYANETNCNHVKAFAEMGYVSWNPQNRKFRVGDIVYMFLSNDRSVRFKTKVVEVGVRRSDFQYWHIKPNDGYTCKLEYVAEYNGEALSEEELRKHGFKGGGSIELPMCGNTELLDYIEEQFNNK